MSKKSLEHSGPFGAAIAIQEKNLAKQINSEIEEYYAENQEELIEEEIPEVQETEEKPQDETSKIKVKADKKGIIVDTMLFLSENDTKPLTKKYLTNVVKKLEAFKDSEGTPSSFKVLTANNVEDLKNHFSDINVKPHSCFIAHTGKKIFDDKIESYIILEDKDNIFNKKYIFKTTDQKHYIILRPSA